VQIYDTHCLVGPVDKEGVERALLGACASLTNASVAKYRKKSKFVVHLVHSSESAVFKVTILPDTKPQHWWLNFIPRSSRDRSLFTYAYFMVTSHPLLAPHIHSDAVHPNYTPRFVTEQHRRPFPSREAALKAMAQRGLMCPLLTPSELAEAGVVPLPHLEMVDAVEEDFGRIGFALLFCKEHSMQLTGLQMIVKMAQTQPHVAHAAGTPYVVAAYLTSHFREPHGGSYHVAVLCEEAARKSQAPSWVQALCHSYVVYSKQFLCERCAACVDVVTSEVVESREGSQGRYRCIVCVTPGDLILDGGA
jgi:hypothetical protein